jgi:hypothetical protein
MFFKRFKTLALEKYISTAVQTRAKDFGTGPIQSFGVIFDYKNYHNYEFFQALCQDLNVNTNRVRFIAYIGKEKQTPNGWDSFYSIEDFDWKGLPHSANIDEFTEYPFDLLISYYRPERLELNVLTALSKAKLKVGISNSDQRLNDLTIDIKPKEIEVFRIELLKYLKTLNKL